MNKKIFMPFMAAALALGFASCANDDLLGEGSQVDNPAAGGNVAVFTNAPKAQRANGPRKTTMNAEGKFFWSQGDKIFVKNGSDYIPSNNAADTKKERENFYLSGTFTAPSYPVVFTGTGNTSHNSVTIKAQQDQAQPNDAEHIGTDGDCGNASAGKTGDGTYSFDLVHRATYLIVNLSHAYYTNASDVRIRKITIRSTSSAPLTGIYSNFNEDVASLGDLTPISPGKEIVVTLGDGQTGWPTPKREDVQKDNSLWDKNRAFVVMAPGNHALEFIYEYTRDGSTWLTETKTVTARDYAAGYFTNVRHILSEGRLNGGHYLGQQRETVGDWTPNVNVTGSGAHQNVASFYFWDAPVEKYASYSIATGQVYTYWNEDPKFYMHYYRGYPEGTAPLVWPEEANLSAKDMPNVNEAWWYLSKGDVHFDWSATWSMDGGLTERCGGYWIKKSRNIPGFNANAIEDGRDLRTYTETNTVTEDGITYEMEGSQLFIFPRPAQSQPANPNDYFFLPSIGWIGNTYSSIGGNSIGLLSTCALWTKSTSITRWRATDSQGAEVETGDRTSAYAVFLYTDHSILAPKNARGKDGINVLHPNSRNVRWDGVWLPVFYANLIE